MAETDAAVEIVAAGVRTAVRDGVGHRHQPRAIDGVCRVEVEPSCNPAHRSDTRRLRAVRARHLPGRQARRIELFERRDHALERVALSHLGLRCLAESTCQPPAR